MMCIYCSNFLIRRRQKFNVELSNQNCRCDNIPRDPTQKKDITASKLNIAQKYDP